MQESSNSNVDLEQLSKLESELMTVSSDDLVDNAYHGARRAIGSYIADIGGLNGAGMSLPDLIDEASRFQNTKAVRNAALAVTRVASRDVLLPEPTNANKLRLRVVSLFEKGLHDIADKAGILSKSQTFEKYERIRQLHPLICAWLEPLRSLANVGINYELLLACKQEVLKCLSKDIVAAYLGPYDVKRIKTAFTHIFSSLQATVQLNDSTFITNLQSLREFIAGEAQWCTSFPTFLSEDYYKPALLAFNAALSEIESAAKDRFVCMLVTKRPCPGAAAKRYPLHEIGRMIRVAIPMQNKGPGIAGSVRCDVEIREEEVQFDPVLFLGDVRPSDFLIALNIMVEKPYAELNVSLRISWSETGTSERCNASFSIKVSAQNQNVDWRALKLEQPYTPEVAEGDEFVGRAAKVNSIASRFLRPRMNSCFITGQKRIGKTSLAKAVQAKLEEESKNFKILYLEYGAYSAMDPVRTVEKLGMELYEALQHERRGSSTVAQPIFEGTLAPLVKISDALAKEEPDLKFLFILDEFDSISPEMYRYGPLAEAFFSNIRTLSSKRNVAFLLVGGEKMPFVMSAQGDELNKFTSEQLDYFNRTEEWFDYQDLVRRPVREKLNWDDSAVAALFELTNGHPYYTKLLCATAFQTAIKERDADLTEEDVLVSARRLVTELDSNSFAHLWKDGISDADRQRAEVTELNRRRTLCACSRSLRTSPLLTAENVYACTAGLKISSSDISLMLNDFARRGVLIEKSGGFSIAVPFFDMWLRDQGASKLLSDALAEEYETKEQLEEEKARVTSAEVSELVSHWDLYRGAPVTDQGVRTWLEQVPTNREQRLLFKLLQNLRFVSHSELRMSLKTMHGFLTSFIPPHFSEKRSDRRRDVLITWVDGAGKSGNVLAGLYAEENRIIQRAVIPPEAISGNLKSAAAEGRPISAIVIVDDFVGTGNSLSSNLVTFMSENGDEIKRQGVHVLVSAFTATPTGEQAVRSALRKFDVEIDFRIADPTAARGAAFSQEARFWASDEEKGRAKEICQRFGRIVHRTNPLGYGDQGLLLVFPDACPNNSLPILHSGASGKETWRPLFERPKH